LIVTQATKFGENRTSRDTGTGRILEQMIIPTLIGGGYQVYPQQHIGERFGGTRRHFIDVIAEDKRGEKFLVSLKWQQVSGTAEQKVPFEVICLSEAILSSDEFSKAYLVLGGEGWTLREFFIKGGLQKHLKHSDLVTIITLEGFVAKANRGEL
jgi:hypothetical protein